MVIFCDAKGTRSLTFSFAILFYECEMSMEEEVARQKQRTNTYVDGGVLEISIAISDRIYVLRLNWLGFSKKRYSQSYFVVSVRRKSCQGFHSFFSCPGLGAYLPHNIHFRHLRHGVFVNT
jgi:hypothetical protein